MPLLGFKPKLALWNVLFECFAVAWDDFKTSSIESSDKRIEVPQFSMAITFKRETSAQIEEGLTCVLCRAVILAVWFDRFSSYRNYRLGESNSFFGPNMASEVISECLILKIFLGEQAPRPSYLVHS